MENDTEIEPPALGHYWAEVAVKEGEGRGAKLIKTSEQCEFSTESRGLWHAVWRSPVAQSWPVESRDAVLRWIVLRDRFHARGELTLGPEIRAHEKMLGLTPEAARLAAREYESQQSRKQLSTDGPSGRGASLHGSRRDRLKLVDLDAEAV